MGLLSYCGICDLLYEAAQNHFQNKSILMLGKQVIYHSRQELYVYAKRIGATLDYEKLKDDTIHNSCDCYSFFYAMGCREVHAMDISEYEGADIIYDLNNDDIPSELLERFDYIIDGGTTEHIFNFTSALHNIARMLTVGGRIFHYIPASGSINHGYYSLSPQVLEDFYKSNGFRVDKLNLILKKEDYVSPITKLEDCMSTEPDYRFYNLRDVEGLHGYVGILRCIASKEKASDIKLHLPKQNHWYGIMNDELLYDMLSCDLHLNDLKIKIGIWGCNNLGKIILWTISRHPNYSKEKVKGFFTFDEDNRDTWEGYPVMHGSDIASSGINILFLASYDDYVYGQLRPIENFGIQIIRLNDYMAIMQK